MPTTKAQISLRISAFVVRYLDSIIPLFSISEISSHYLASVAEQIGLSLPLSETPKTGFLVTRLMIDHECLNVSHMSLITPKTGFLVTRLMIDHECLNVSHMSLITRKPVFGVCDQVRLKLACSATETS